MQKSRWAPKPESEEKEAQNAPTTTQAAPKEAPAPVQVAPPAPQEPAPEIISYDPAYHDPSIDPFAQTASTDDLFFDDDVTPIAEPVVEQNTIEHVPDAEYLQEAVAPPVAPRAHLAPQAPREPRNAERGGRGRGRGRGRGGRGRGGGGGGHVGDIRELDKVAKEEEAKPAEPAPATSEPAQVPEGTEAGATATAPTDPKEKPTHSVRGDRTLTGGPARTRLTEDQLNQKLASMRSKNEALQTAHARAEADLANFEAREAVLKKNDIERKKLLAEKQKAERQNRQQMMGEREKNRQRKLNASQGREWEFEKEEGFSGTGEEKRRGAARGAHGGIATSRHAESSQPTQSEHFEEAAPQSQRGRGRGRGGRGSRGGRGDHEGSRPTDNKKRDQHPPSASDFPELPSSSTAASGKVGGAPKTLDFPIKGKATEAPETSKAEASADAKTNDSERPDLKTHDSFGIPSPMEKGRSWADEVA